MSSMELRCTAGLIEAPMSSDFLDWRGFFSTLDGGWTLKGDSIGSLVVLERTDCGVSLEEWAIEASVTNVLAAIERRMASPGSAASWPPRRVGGVGPATTPRRQSRPI